MTAMTGEVWVTVASTASERECAELGLVLTARGIEHRRLPAEAGWSLSVPERQAAAARAEITDYRSENRAPREAPRPPAAIGRGWPGTLSYAAVLMLVAIFVQQSPLGLDWLGAGRMDAGRMSGGEWWRAVTALTLHVDADHLLGNLVFGAFFGFFAARYLGTGVAWAAILAAGFLGNVLNGLLQAPDHRAIGASTAVFGALGLLTAYVWRRHRSDGMPLRARVAPLVAGIALLAYTGTGGENTDVVAHLTGFVSGLGLGLWFARHEPPSSAAAQWAAAALAAAALIGSWIWAFVATA